MAMLDRFMSELTKTITRSHNWTIGTDPTHRRDDRGGDDLFASNAAHEAGGGRLDRDACEAAIAAGVAGLYDNLRNLAASDARLGYSLTEIIEHLQGLMLQCRGKRDEKTWREYYDYIPELARSALRLVGNGNGARGGYSQSDTTSRAETHEQLLRSATLFVPIAAVELPPRRWLWASHYMRGAVSCTIAGGGFGKSALAVYEAFRMVEAGHTVWFITGEEDVIEIQRKFAALAKHYHVQLDSLAGRLFVDDRDSFPLILARSGRDSTIYEEAALKNFEQQISDNKIDAAILDPLVEFHAMKEADNVGLAGLAYRLRSVGKRCDAAIELLHHVRKPPSGIITAVSVDDARGGGALVNACRSARVLNKMTREEAQLASISEEDRYRYIKLDNPKRNYQPPEKATWFVLRSEILDNADNVQAIERYEFPSALAEASVNLLNDVEAWLREKPYRVSSQSPDWLGVPIAKRLGLSLAEPDAEATCKRINRMLKAWERAGSIIRRKLRDAERKERDHYVLPDHKPTLTVIDGDAPDDDD